MKVLTVSGYEDWRRQARRLLGQGTPPDQVVFHDGDDPQELLPLAAPATLVSAAPDRREKSGTAADAPPRSGPAAPRVPRRFITASMLVACHRRPERWHLLYRVLFRLQCERHDLLDLETDQDVRELLDMEAQVRRDEHKMRAFVRFTPVSESGVVRYVAWYEPDHLIVRMAAPFFSDRFSSMQWSILTPDLSAHWDGTSLTFTAGVPAPMKPPGGSIEDLWRTYYAAVFNPARANLPALLREMPMRRWQGLPEAALITGLLSGAQERTGSFAPSGAARSARPFVPASGSLGDLRSAAAGCQGCELYRPATQVVFGEGPENARLTLVGEQPGDREDLEGRPFVGPAGEVLQRAIAAAGLDQGEIYVTNAVKHFSFEERGKRRIHKTPRISEVRACRPWLEAELHAVRPSCVVCLGSTAARALLGPQTRVMESRGRVIAGTAWAAAVIVTVHPSAVLRSDDGERYFEMLVHDLSLAARTVRDEPAAGT